MRRWLLLIALGVLTACVPSGPPSTPAPDPTFAVNVCLTDQAGQPIAGTMTMDGIQPRGVTAVPASCLEIRGLLRAGFTVTGSAEGYSTSGAPIVDAVNQTLNIRLTRTARSNAGESEPLHIEGTTFRRADGSIFPWIGASDFALFARFARGEDITPILDERIALGFNLLRVMLMFDGAGIGGQQASGLGDFTPASTPDYYARLRAFVDLLASRGLRVELVYFADADRCDGTGCLMPARATREAHLVAAQNAVRGAWNITSELCNECFKNLADPETYTSLIDRTISPWAYGTKLPDGDIPDPATWPTLDYLTPHDHERKDEWPRTSRGYGEITDAFRRPVIADEPIGYTEPAEMRGGRWINVDDAAYFGATMQMFAAGATYHSDDGVASRLFRPTERAAAEAFTWAARWVPPEAQLAPYQRGGDCGSAGIGEMPIQHCDLETGAPSRALRSFCKYAFGQEYCVRIRPVGPTIARDGWRITSEPRLGFVTLTR